MSSHEDYLTAYVLFEKQINEALEIYKINTIVVGHMTGAFEQLAKFADTARSYEVARRARRFKNVMENLPAYSPLLRIPFQLLCDQVVVLSVASLENYLRTIFSLMIKSNPQKIIEHHTDLKISHKLMLDFGFEIDKYLDQIVLDNSGGDINFQDLQSTIRTFNKYFDKNLTENMTESLKQQIILAQASRHIILHKARIIDSKFMQQIRSTKYKDDYKEGEELLLDRDKSKELVCAIKEFGDIIREVTQHEA